MKEDKKEILLSMLLFSAFLILLSVIYYTFNNL